MNTGNNDYDCVMPAAGESKRMGDWKLLLPIGAETIVERSVRNALGFCKRVILVVGHRADELVERFSAWPQVVTIPNPEYSFGMFSSIRQGVREVATPRFFVALADMPLIPPSVFSLLASQGVPGEAVVRPFFRGHKGHPVLLPASVIDKILRFDNSHSMREVLRDVPLHRTSTEYEGVVRDIDSPGDYRNLNRSS